MTKRPLHRPRCYCGCGKPTRSSSFFATQTCAAEFAEALVSGNDNAHWCAWCRNWTTLRDNVSTATFEEQHAALRSARCACCGGPTVAP